MPDKIRPNTVLDHPALSIGANGFIAAVHTPQRTEAVYAPLDLSQQFAYFEGKLEGGDIVVMPVEEFEYISAAVRLLSPEADEFFTGKPSVVSVPFQPHLIIVKRMVL